MEALNDFHFLPRDSPKIPFACRIRMSLRRRFAQILNCRLRDRRAFQVRTITASLRPSVCAAIFFALTGSLLTLNALYAGDSPYDSSARSSFLTGSGDGVVYDGSSSGLLQNMVFPQDSTIDATEDVALDPLTPTPENQALADRYEKKTINGATLYAPTPSVSADPIAISAQYGWKGASDDFGEVYVLYGDCRVEQGVGRASAPKGVVWIARNQEMKSNGADITGTSVWLYLAQDETGTIQLDLNSVCPYAKSDGATWLGRFVSLKDVDLRIAFPGENQLLPDEIYGLASRSLKAAVNASSRGGLFGQSAQPTKRAASEELRVPQEPVSLKTDDGILGWSLTGDGDTVATIPETSLVTEYRDAVKPKTTEAPRRRLRFSSRYDNEYSISGAQNASEGGKNVFVISNGFTLVVQGIGLNDETIGDTLELSADQAMVWTSAGQNLGDITTPSDVDFEIYLEGAVVFRLGDNVVYADRMYYDVKNYVGVIEDAEMYAHAPGDEDAVFRLGAKKITQQGYNSIYADSAWVSTSQMGRPNYRLQANSLVAETRSAPLRDAATGDILVDPKTGMALTDDKTFLVAENNFVSVGNLPILYWPWMATEVSADRSLYLRYLKFGHDKALGTQILTSWNLYQILGMTKTRPEGTSWDLNLDYLSRRGFGHGTTFQYERDSIFGWNTRAVGTLNYYGISDRGRDNLGYGRRSLEHPHKYRYRGIWKHRQELGALDCGLGLCDNCCIRDGWTFTGQFGKSSDRNYLPQFFEEEWNTSSNPITSLELKRTVNNRSLSFMGSFRTDKFYTQTSWLPRFDHYWLGQALGESPFVWYEHTKVGFAQFRVADAPYDVADRDLFRYLDWELATDSANNDVYNSSRLQRDSLVFSTRHEIDLPIQAGPLKATPYALGEYGFWGRGVDRKNISRVYGQLGVRLNLPIWKVDTDVESKTWYVNGVAHKMNLVADFSYTDASKNFDDLVLFDQIDDFQIEDFRRRYSVTTFAGKGAGFSDAIPLRFDERYYAIRSGLLEGNVTSPSTELVDEQMLVRLAWNNRWQTKRGPADARRVVDWITFNAGINLYPKNRHNFGKVPGFIDFDATWQVGDRFAVLSSGLYDVWGTGQKITRLGVQRRRPGLSSCYLGIDRLDGPIDSTYLNFGLTYRTSERWGLGFSNSYDLSEGINAGQRVSISRIGESFVFTLGASRNESKDNWGVSLSVEPNFMFDKNRREDGVLGLGSM